MKMTRIFLFDRWLEVDREQQVVRLIPFRVPSILTGVAMLAIPASLLAGVGAGARALTATGVALALAYSALAIVFLAMPFARSNSLVELDLAKKVARRRGAETPLSETAMRFVPRTRLGSRGELFATIGGEEVRLLYLANDFVEVARLVLHAAAAGIRGEPEALLVDLTEEAKRHAWKAYVAPVMLPLVMVGAGAIFYWL